MIDEALSDFGIVAATAEIIEISARLRCCVEDSVCARQMAVANPDNPQRPCRCAAELVRLFDKDNLQARFSGRYRGSAAADPGADTNQIEFFIPLS
jgi:hypothetical protein